MDLWDRLMTAIEAWQAEEFLVMFYAIRRDLNRADRYAKEAVDLGPMSFNEGKSAAFRSKPVLPRRLSVTVRKHDQLYVSRSLK